MMRKGPRRMIAEDRRVPLLDIGTLDRIRDGSIKVRGGIDHFTRRRGVRRRRAEPFDAVILATGFRPDLRPLLPDCPDCSTATDCPVTGDTTASPACISAARRVSPTGQLREIGIEAQRIARLAARRR